jgi:cytochrome P450
MASTPEWNSRRSNFIRALGINYASRHIPIILKQCEKTLKSFSKGRVNMSKAASKLTYTIISSILFGEDFKTEIDKTPYYDTKLKQVLMLGSHSSIARLSEDSAASATNPLNLIFPFLFDFNIGANN